MRQLAIAGALAVACTLAGCASSAKPGGAGSVTSSPPATTAAATTTTPIGGHTMTAPHIACRQGTFAQTYDGADPRPVELCLLSGAVAHLTITVPMGQTWTLPTITPSGIVASQASRAGADLRVTATAEHSGTATLAVPGTEWRLQIAVAG